MRSLLCLAIIGCAKPPEATAPAVPPVVSQAPASGLGGLAVARFDGALVWVDLWGEDAAGVARDALAAGARPGSRDAHPQVARWLSSAVLDGRTRVRVTPPGAPDQIVDLVGAAPLVDGDALGMRAWFRAFGEGGGPWGVVALREDPRLVVTGAVTGTCAALGVTPIASDDPRVCASCEPRCEAILLPDGARVVATSWPADGDLPACVAASLQYPHGGFQPWATTCGAGSPRVEALVQAGDARLLVLAGPDGALCLGPGPGVPLRAEACTAP